MAFEAIPDDFPILRGRGLLLRELSEDDLPAWFARRTDVAACRMAGDPVAESMDDVAAGLAYHRTAFREKTALRWSIVPDDFGASVGSIGFSTLDAEARTAELGGAVGRAHWGRGFATSAALLAIEYGFGELNLARIEGVAQATNAQSIRVMEKAGFRFERLLPEHELVDGVPTGFVLYARERD